MNPKQQQQQRSSSPCELCNGEASLYCDADSAYLCWPCDRAVHSANFLVARHVRRLTCSNCNSFSDSSLSLSGPGSDPITSLCASCDPNPTSPSSCISSSGGDSPPPAATASATMIRTLERWGNGMGMGLRTRRRCADVVGPCWRQITGTVPVIRAAAMWFAVRSSNSSDHCCTCDQEDMLMMMIKRLEKCSGVPAKLIVFYQARITRAKLMMRRGTRRRRPLEFKSKLRNFSSYHNFNDM